VIRLPLYPTTDLPIDGVKPLQPDPLCQRCDLGGVGDHTCMRPAGEPGGVLVVGDRPSAKGALLGRPWATHRERRWAQMIRGWANAPVAFDYALKCAGTAKDVDKAMAACAPYMRRALDVTKPERILCFGHMAAKAILGRTANTAKVRRAWTRTKDGTLVFLFPDVFITAGNRVRTQWLREDVEWACTADPGAVPWDAYMNRVEDQDDAAAAWEALRGRHVMFDTETFGKAYRPIFRIVCLSFAEVGSDVVWMFPGEALQEGDPRRPYLLKILHGARLGGHNLKYDLNAVRLVTGEDVGAKWTGADTMIHAKQIRADGSGGLDELSNLVGMGGHKGEAAEHFDVCRTVLKRMRNFARKPVPVEWEYEERVNKAGKKQRRKRVTKSRPPTPEEARSQADEAWVKKRSVNKVQTTFADLTGIPAPTDAWMEAIMADGEADWYVHGLTNTTVEERYNARDTCATARLAAHLEPQMAPEYRALWDSHLGRAPWAVGWVEHWGIGVDRQAVSSLSAFVDAECSRLLAQIHGYAPGLEPGSPDQLSAFLFDPPSRGGLGLVPIKRSRKTGKPSTDKQVMTTLAAAANPHPAIKLIMEWRELDKIQGTYAQGMMSHISPDGRIHCSFNIMGAETGRMSCTDPNMQTIPSRGQYAKRVKDCFVAAPGYRLVQLDYKTLEMRVAAMLSGDPVMIQIFLNGEDPHRRTAELVSDMLWGNDFETCGLGYTLDTAPDEDARAALAKEQKHRRGVCKWVNFGTVYGQSPETLAEQAGISVKEAEQAQDIVLGRFKVLRRWIKRTIADASRSGSTWTWWDGGIARRRPVPDIGDEDKGSAGHGQRQAFNTPVQGTGHEYCLASGVSAVQWILDDGLDARLVMMVHDSLVFEVAEGDVPELVLGAKDIMEGWPTAHGLPLEVDVEMGTAWGSLEEVDVTTLAP